MKKEDFIEPRKRKKEEERSQDNVEKSFLVVTLTSNLVDEFFKFLHDSNLKK
jgi:hypothetical protein